MAYRLKIKKPIETEIHKVATEQIDKAVTELQDDTLDQSKTVHQVRKRCKKIRAVLRLVRGSLADAGLYSVENAYFRDAARELSALRDAEVLVKTYDKLMDVCNDDIELGLFSDIRHSLVFHREQLADQHDNLEKKLHKFCKKMTDAKNRISSWNLDQKGFDAVTDGLAKTYQRGRKAIPKAYDDPTGENFHDWRKRVKYHWYHCRLLRNIYRPIMKARVDQLDKLATILGDYHDLVVLRSYVESSKYKKDETNIIKHFLERIDQRLETMRCKAQPLGKKLFAEKSKQIIRRFESYFNV